MAEEVQELNPVEKELLEKQDVILIEIEKIKQKSEAQIG